MIYVDSSIPLLDPVVRPQRCAPGRGPRSGSINQRATAARIDPAVAGP